MSAPAFPAHVGDAVPTFSIDRASHNRKDADNLGFQMAYMSGDSRCFQGTLPTFTPVISNPRLFYTRSCKYATGAGYGYPAEQTAIECPGARLWDWVNKGEYTIDNVPGYPLGNTPLPYTITFGHKAGPPVVSTKTSIVTYPALVTTVAESNGIPHATATEVVSLTSTVSKTSTTTVTAPVTVPYIDTVCPSMTAPPAPTSTSTSKSYSAVPPPPPSSSSKSSTVTPAPSSYPTISPPRPSPSTSKSSTLMPPPPPPSTSKSSTVIPPPHLPSTSKSSTATSAPTSYPGFPPSPRPTTTKSSTIMPPPPPMTTKSSTRIAPGFPSFVQCIAVCMYYSDCQAVSYVPGGDCYLKSGIGEASVNPGIWGARMVPYGSQTSVIPIPAPSTSTTLSSTSRPTTARNFEQCNNTKQHYRYQHPYFLFFIYLYLLVAGRIFKQCDNTKQHQHPYFLFFIHLYLFFIYLYLLVAGRNFKHSNGTIYDSGKKKYLVLCDSDINGATFPGPLSPTYPGSFTGCLDDCSHTPGCVSVSYVKNGPCYLKGSAWGSSPNSNIIGGELIIGSNPYPTASSSTMTADSYTAASPASGFTTVTLTSCASTSGTSASAAAPTGSSLSCPEGDGNTYTTNCGASYVLECGVDRFGGDLNNGLVFTDTWEQCVQACDKTSGCVNVSWVSGVRGACYMKSSVSDIHKNSNIQGGRKISGCSKLKLHRKRVAAFAPIQRHQFLGPDHTLVPDVSITTVFLTRRPTITKTLTGAGTLTTTSTQYAESVVTITTTTVIPSTIYSHYEVTSCPTTARTPAYTAYTKA
ncbi:carbohydrate-binding wsc [Pyrenophora seminiperda CCB06]|uniref:Carbohydrate-binding wsc n=1 Tax=Pyrenophora seminiperda CCB06 TaxID=1302712 RepID=A0A3M7M5G6_9PLEO|nr:carbohydrate-binding wsc [Pyrenophora seminiperda CCB06]